jgi:hypothetical protein
MLRDIAYEINDPLSIMESYKYLGLAFQYARSYHLGVVCFKMILLFAWFHMRRDWELIAFNLLAVEYFYLGEIRNSSFFNERASRGIYEADFSSAKRISR